MVHEYFFHSVMSYLPKRRAKADQVGNKGNRGRGEDSSAFSVFGVSTSNLCVGILPVAAKMMKLSKVQPRVVS